jgi:hypothetical protein
MLQAMQEFERYDSGLNENRKGGLEEELLLVTFRLVDSHTFCVTYV